MPITPDTKDWTWVLERPCPDCRFDTQSFPRGEVGALLRENASAWRSVLSQPSARNRPSPDVWSPLEYGCHVRDVCRIYDMRLGLMLTQENPRFANWDQDATAVEERYSSQDSVSVANELVEAAEVLAGAFDRVIEGDWTRPGVRSDGAHFTVESFARYFMHDPVHHLYDVTGRQHAFERVVSDRTSAHWPKGMDMADTTALTGEREDLLQTLRKHRYFLRFTVQGLTDEQAAQRTTASELCLGGLIKHVAATERQWINFMLDGPAAMTPATSDDDAESTLDWAAAFQMTAGDTLPDLLAQYDEVAKRTDELVATLPDLDHAHPLPEAPWFEAGARWSARRVLLHVIAETSQHAGHADILRESLDGQKTMG